MKLPLIIIRHPIAALVLTTLLILVLASAIHGRTKKLPKGTSQVSHWMPAENVNFLYDLTYRVKDERQVEQQIFGAIFKLIEEAKTYLVLDMFLFNDEYARSSTYPALSQSLVNKLIAKKQQHPEMVIQVITDPINTFYGAYSGKMIQQLKDAGVPVTLTKLERLRHSNPIFSTFYAPFLSHFGTAGEGWISNPFSPDSPKVTLRAFLKMLNFRANHRKVIVSEKQAIVSSANPHDASFYHSNIAFSFEGPLIHTITQAELDIVEFSSGQRPEISLPTSSVIAAEPMQSIRWITEGKIKQQWLDIIESAQEGDQLQIAMFYFSERRILHALKSAAKRGVNIRVVLDANKDAFGRQKNGIPNRQIAAELMAQGYDNLEIRWYHTEGEQFHSKMMAAKINSLGKTLVVGGSANLTRRNIADYNLEADVCIQTDLDSELSKQTDDYFNRIWNNTNGRFTDDYAAYADTSFLRKIIYRLQEATGACTF